MFESKVFLEQIYCIEESAWDIVGTFRRPTVIRPPGHCSPLDPISTPLDLMPGEKLVECCEVLTAAGY